MPIYIFQQRRGAPAPSAAPTPESGSSTFGKVNYVVAVYGLSRSPLFRYPGIVNSYSYPYIINSTHHHHRRPFNDPSQDASASLAGAVAACSCSWSVINAHTVNLIPTTNNVCIRPSARPTPDWIARCNATAALSVRRAKGLAFDFGPNEFSMLPIGAGSGRFHHQHPYSIDA